MIALRNVFAAVTFIGALAASIGAAALQPAVMGVAGLVAAIAAILWGLLSLLTPAVEPEEQLCVEPDPDVEEDELQYTPVREGRLPYWDTDVWGAVE